MGHIPVPPYRPAYDLFKFAPGKFVGGSHRYDPIAALSGISLIFKRIISEKQ